MLWVDRESAGLKAGAGAPPPSAADGLDPVRSPVLRLGMRLGRRPSAGGALVQSGHDGVTARISFLAACEHRVEDND